MTLFKANDLCGEINTSSTLQNTYNTKHAINLIDAGGKLIG
jgi:hypothetical protein